MKEYFKKLPKEIKGLINLAADTASRAGISAYLVGGFVRDLLLGVRNLDLDIVIEGDGIRFAEEFASILKTRLIRHKRFGTATIVREPNLKIDIATVRKEYYPRPAHLPEVSPGTLKDDLKRRDFTINAMAISITGRDFSRLIDFFDGKSDLRNKKIRILHNLSFIDDPTRILRAIRFEKRYNFRIEPKTLAYLKEAVKLGMLNKVEPQRLRDELIPILKEEHLLKSIRRIRELAGLKFINPHLSVSKKIYDLMSSIRTQILWFKSTHYGRRQPDTWLIYFMALTDSLGINDVKSVCKRYGLRKGELNSILTYKKISDKFIQTLNGDKVRPSAIFNAFEPLSYEVILLLKAKYKNRNLQRYIKDFFEIYNGMRIQIRGDDLQRLGIAPGPYYQKVFAKVLKAKLEGSVRTGEEELALIKKIIKREL